MCKPFGKLSIVNIDTKPKKHNLLRNLIILVIGLIILIKLIRRKKAEKRDISLISKMIAFIKGAK
jgi:hypothetical protein